MPKIICHNCGAVFYGWSLIWDDYTICDKCGVAIPLNIAGEYNGVIG